MTKVRIISDVHGKIDEYLEITRSCEYSVQIGDMGFDYSSLRDLDSKRHVFFKGNHDNYSKDSYCSSYLGRFGTEPPIFPLNFFYIGGAYSIDQRVRIPFQNWFPNEELSYKEMYDCINYSGSFNRHLFLSHEAPTVITKDLDKSPLVHWGLREDFESNTSKMLQMIWEAKKPKLWIFGHHHKNIDTVIDGTRFICMPELQYVDINCDTMEVEKIEI